METFSAQLAFWAAKNSLVPGEFPAQSPVARSFDVMICAWINGWVYNREAADRRRCRTHYDVTLKNETMGQGVNNHGIDQVSEDCSVLAPDWSEFLFVKYENIGFQRLVTDTWYQYRLSEISPWMTNTIPLSNVVVL